MSSKLSFYIGPLIKCRYANGIAPYRSDKIAVDILLERVYVVSDGDGKHIYAPNMSYNGRVLKTSFESDEMIVPLFDDNIQMELIAFTAAYKKELEKLEELYGSSNVQTYFAAYSKYW